MSGNRAERMARVIREEASRVILYELADPRIGFVTVTKVKVSADLQHARVYVSVLGDEAARRRTMKALDSAINVVRKAVGPRLKTRTMPSIEFEFDPSVEGSIRVSQLIREARLSDADGGRPRQDMAGENAAGAPSPGQAGTERAPACPSADPDPSGAEGSSEGEAPG